MRAISALAADSTSSRSYVTTRPKRRSASGPSSPTASLHGEVSALGNELGGRTLGYRLGGRPWLKRMLRWLETSGSGPGRPKSQPWPRVAPAPVLVPGARASRCLQPRSARRSPPPRPGRRRGSVRRPRSVRSGEAEVQLDDLRSEEWHQGKGRGPRAHVVERDTPALIADPAGGPEQLRGSSRDRSLGDLDDDAQPFRAIASDARQAVGRVSVKRGRFDGPGPVADGPSPPRRLLAALTLHASRVRLRRCCQPRSELVEGY